MYKALLIAPDGDWVTDYKRETIDNVWEDVMNQGSRWFFYPFAFVIKDHGSLTTSNQRIVSAPDIPEGVFEWLKGKSIKTACKYIADNDWSSLF